MYSKSIFKLGVIQRTLRRNLATNVQIKPYSDIPGPKPIPILGNAWRFLPVIGTLRLDDFSKFSKDLQKEFGDIVKISKIPGRSDMLFIYDPTIIEHVYRSEGTSPMRIIFDSVQHFRSKVRKDFFEGNKGLVNEAGEKWQDIRSKVNQALMQPKIALQYVPKFDKVAQEFVERMKILRDNKNEMPNDFALELQKWALESISLVALDTRMGCLNSNLSTDSDPQKLIIAARAIFDLSFILDMKSLPTWKIYENATLKEFIKQSNTFLEIAHKYVEKAEKRFIKTDNIEDMSVLQRLLKLDPSTKRAVIMALDLIFAGIDTTGNTAATVLYNVAKYPHVQEKLFDELTKYMPEKNTDLTSESLEQMKYLRACIKESIRMDPIIGGNNRTLTKDTTIGGYMVPKGTEIFMNHSLLYKNDKHFINPEKFIPERWMRGCPQHEKVHPFVFLPFGYGPRQCVGMRLANLELETLLARVIRNFKLDWHYDDLTFAFKLLAVPNKPIKITVIDR